jgi:hypothetical protein
VTHCDIWRLCYIEKMFLKCLYMKSIRLSGTRAEVIIMACARLPFSCNQNIRSWFPQLCGEKRRSQTIALISLSAAPYHRKGKQDQPIRRRKLQKTERSFERALERDWLIDTTTRAKDYKNGQFHSYRPDNFYSTSDISPRGSPLPPTSTLPEHSLFPSLSVLLILKGIFFSKCQAQ